MRILLHPVVPWAAVAVAAAARVGLVQDLIARGNELSRTSFVWTELLLDAAFFTYTAIGALIASRRPANPVGWIFIAIGLSWDLLNAARPALLSVLREPGVAALDPHTWPALAWILSLLSNAWIVSFLLLPVLFLVFPAGRLISPRWRPVLWLVAVDGESRGRPAERRGMVGCQPRGHGPGDERTEGGGLASPLAAHDGPPKRVRLDAVEQLGARHSSRHGHRVHGSGSLFYHVQAICQRERDAFKQCPCHVAPRGAEADAGHDPAVTRVPARRTGSRQVGQEENAPRTGIRRRIPALIASGLRRPLISASSSTETP